MRFAGKVAIVTGAGQGIGEGYAHALAHEGARTVIADINAPQATRVAKDINAAGGEAIAITVDVSSDASTRAMAKAANDRFGRIDFLVNNAALFGGNTVHSVVEADLDLYYRLININMHGCLLATRAVVPFMRAQSGGAIVNQSSTAAWTATGIYSVAKAGMNALTTSLARELGPANIRVNAIAPGPTDTEALHSVVPDSILSQLVAGMPLPRLGTPAELAAAVVFLLSDDAKWVTGHVMNVDGGHFMRG